MPHVRINGKQKKGSRIVFFIAGINNWNKIITIHWKPGKIVYTGIRYKIVIMGRASYMLGISMRF